MRMIFVLLISCTILQAQSGSPFSVSAGVKLGAPINEIGPKRDPFGSTTQGRWTGGPSVELHLPRNFSVEFNALYRTIRNTRSSPLQFGVDLNPYTASFLQDTSAWDFPLLLKYRFRWGSTRPFLSAGHYWSHESRKVTNTTFCNGPAGSCRPPSLVSEPAWNYREYSETIRGLVTGAGIEFRTRYVNISPEFRFQRPTNSYPRDNRFTGMVGFSFGGKK